MGRKLAVGRLKGTDATHADDDEHHDEKHERRDRWSGAGHVGDVNSTKQSTRLASTRTPQQNQ